MFSPPPHHEVKTPVVVISGAPGSGRFQVTFATIAQVTLVETEEGVSVSYLIKLQDGNVGPVPADCEIVKLALRSWDSQSIGTALLDRAKPQEKAEAPPVVAPAPPKVEPTGDDDLPPF
jgi:hypothetical protein